MSSSSSSSSISSASSCSSLTHRTHHSPHRRRRPSRPRLCRPRPAAHHRTLVQAAGRWCPPAHEQAAHAAAQPLPPPMPQLGRVDWQRHLCAVSMCVLVRRILRGTLARGVGGVHAHAHVWIARAWRECPSIPLPCLAAHPGGPTHRHIAVRGVRMQTHRLRTHSLRRPRTRPRPHRRRCQPAVITA